MNLTIMLFLQVKYPGIVCFIRVNSVTQAPESIIVIEKSMMTSFGETSRSKNRKIQRTSGILFHLVFFILYFISHFPIFLLLILIVAMVIVIVKVDPYHYHGSNHVTADGITVVVYVCYHRFRHPTM